jgi:aminoglycoside phosphotransferase family enzyme
MSHSSPTFSRIFKVRTDINIFLFILSILTSFVDLFRHLMWSYVRISLKLFTYLFHFPLPYSITISNLFYSIHEINGRINSSDEPIRFTYSESTKLPICIKRWERCDEFANLKDSSEMIKLLLDGLHFNRQFAPKVYFGIAPIKIEKSLHGEEKLKYGLLIMHPKQRNIKMYKEYGLVMSRLNQKWRLDQLLHKNKGGYGTKHGMEFLGREIASMHSKVTKMYDEAEKVEGMGSPEHILAKFAFNRERFDKALVQIDNLSHDELRMYKGISDFMELAGKYCFQNFKQRYSSGHIKRCHGDLKITNLWVPDSYLFTHVKRFTPRLFALDCVDFNLEFCYIDTLSDIAMLAVDLEAHLSIQFAQSYARHLTKYFLQIYLNKADENEESAKVLLEYYITEKAMVRAYMCILYDTSIKSYSKKILYNKRIALGKRYLEVALNHAEKLQQCLMLNRHLKR